MADKSADKIKSYLNFARRAGKLTVGVNAVAAVKKGVFLLVADSAAAENTKQKIGKIRRKFACPLVECEGLGEMIGLGAVMLAAVCEENLAGAILSCNQTGVSES